MNNSFTRTELIIGKDALERLKNSHVVIFGIGGVGSFTAESLVRCGVGELTFIDYDTIDVTNINRQIIATTKTVGLMKVDVMKERALEINPNLRVNTIAEKYLPSNGDDFFDESWDYVVDAIDMVSSKLDIIIRCKEKNIPIISSMGTGNKIDPCKFEISDIYKTEVCPLARVMRRELKKRNIDSLKIIYSKEEPIKVTIDSKYIPDGKRSLPGSISFVPSVAGLIIASEVVKDIIC